MSAAPAPLALTMGEPAGVGTEITFKAHRALAGTGPAFFLIDDPVRVARIARSSGAGVQVASIERPADAAAVFSDALPVLPLEDGPFAALDHIELGTPSGATAAAVLGSIEQGVDLCLSGEAAGLVTNPIQKKVLQDAGLGFPGHTELLGSLTAEAPMPGGAARGPVMMLAAGSFRVVPVTVHLPLRAVPDALSADQIVRTGIVTAQALRADFGIDRPRLAVSGLNPHAGEDGAMGHEEEEVIRPALTALREQGVDAVGPFPADTLFHEEARSQYHAALCMYHDQALVPIKTLAFHEAVNLTLGLPIVRTSPDHGTALPIAGRGVARPDSLIAAIRMAAGMAQTRGARAARAA